MRKAGKKARHHGHITVLNCQAETFTWGEHGNESGYLGIDLKLVVNIEQVGLLL